MSLSRAFPRGCGREGGRIRVALETSQSIIGKTTMAILTAYPHIVKENGQSAHLESHPRTRVAMLVMDYLARGLGPDDMVRHYPYLKLAEVHSAMAYYYDHQKEIDQEIQEELDQLQIQVKSQASSPILTRLKAQGLL